MNVWWEEIVLVGKATKLEEYLNSIDDLVFPNTLANALLSALSPSSMVASLKPKKCGELIYLLSRPEALFSSSTHSLEDTLRIAVFSLIYLVTIVNPETGLSVCEHSFLTTPMPIKRSARACAVFARKLMASPTAYWDILLYPLNSMDLPIDQFSSSSFLFELVLFTKRKFPDHIFLSEIALLLRMQQGQTETESHALQLIVLAKELKANPACLEYWLDADGVSNAQWKSTLHNANASVKKDPFASLMKEHRFVEAKRLKTSSSSSQDMLRVYESTLPPLYFEGQNREFSQVASRINVVQQQKEVKNSFVLAENKKASAVILPQLAPPPGLAATGSMKSTPLVDLSLSTSKMVASNTSSSSSAASVLKNKLKLK